MYVCPSTKSFFDFNEICHVGRGRWVMHNSMQYDPIQGQGHEPFKVRNPAIFNSISSTIYNGSWQLTTKFVRARFLIFGLFFCITWLWTWQKRQLWRVDRQSHTGLIYLMFILCSCYRIFCCGCMFVFVVLDLVFQYQAKRLAGKNNSKMTSFASDGT